MIVAESYGGGETVCAVARRHGLCLFLEDGRVDIDNNTVERAIRPLTLNRKNALFAGSDGGAEHWATIASLVETALCRARHKAVYADRRTMPNASCDRGNMKRFARHFDRERVADARHSSHPQRVLRGVDRLTHWTGRSRPSSLGG